MKRLYLTPGIKDEHGLAISYTKLMFPSGCEPHITIHSDPGDIVDITTRISSTEDLMTLLLATDALKRMGVKEISLTLPFLPFARQDRVVNKGEAFSLKVIANILNAQGYSKIAFYDVHSDVAVALVDNSESISNHVFVGLILSKPFLNYTLICPDAGAYKKIYKLAQFLGYKKEIIVCTKIRELNTGKILRTDIGAANVVDEVCYIVDDICDGGATFIGIAKALKDKGAKEVNLIVSHGIFSKGVDHLISNGIDKVYTTNSIYRSYKHDNLVEFNIFKD